MNMDRIKNKKKIWIIIAPVVAVILAIILTVIIVFGAGGGNANDNGYTSISDNSLFGGGVHEVSILEAEGYIVDDGRSEYVIVAPAISTAREVTAINEFSGFFQAATKIALPIISDTGLSFGSDTKFISIGNTALLKQAGIELDYNVLKASGARVLTKEKTIFAAGAEDYGTLNAVYELLGYLIGYEVYSDNIIVHDRDVMQLPLKNFDITEVPDIEFNFRSHGYIDKNPEFMARFRMIDDKEQVFGMTGNTNHNSLDWLPPDEFKTLHPDWYSTDGRNLCYLANGNAEELELMKAEILSRIKQRILLNPSKQYIMIGHEDTQTLCECDACVKHKEHYNGSEAAAVVKFLNDVRANLQDWFDDERPDLDHNQKIRFFAYHALNKPPVRYDASNDKYVPIDDSILLKNVVPYFAESNGDYTVSIVEGSINKSIAENMRGWASISQEMQFWTYGTNFGHYLTPYYSFNGFQTTLQYAAAQKVSAIYAQHQRNNDMSTGWERLKGYLSYKLAWNTNLNVLELYDDYFAASYGPAAQQMRSVFDSYLVLGNMQTSLGYSGTRSIFYNAMQTTLWPRNVLLDWIEGFNAAEAIIEPLRVSDPELHKAYYYNIAAERVSANFLFAELYQTTISTAELEMSRRTAKEDAVLVGITKFAERNGEISTLWSRWGI